VIHHPAGDQVYDLPLATDLPEDSQQSGAEQFSALTVEQLWPHDDVGKATFVLEGDEQGAFGGARALSAGHDAGGSSKLPVRAVEYLAGAQKAQFTQAFAQQGQRMTTQGEAELCVVPRQTLGFGFGGQGQHAFAHRGRLKYSGVGAQGRCLPQGLSAMSRECIKGTGRGKKA